jgi:hypothetical protein
VRQIASEATTVRFRRIEDDAVLAARRNAQAVTAFPGPSGSIDNRGDRTTAPIERICSFRFPSFVFNYAARGRA